MTLWVTNYRWPMSARCPFSPQLATYRCAALSAAKGQSRYFALRTRSERFRPAVHHGVDHRPGDCDVLLFVMIQCA